MRIVLRGRKLHVGTIRRHHALKRRAGMIRRHRVRSNAVNLRRRHRANRLLRAANVRLNAKRHRRANRLRRARRKNRHHRRLRVNRLRLVKLRQHGLPDRKSLQISDLLRNFHFVFKAPDKKYFSSGAFGYSQPTDDDLTGLALPQKFVTLCRRSWTG